MKHTPGPWHRNIRANGHYPVVFAGRNQHVAIATQQTDGAETEANIDLIAAAPDLLAALCAVADDSIAMQGFHEQFRATIRAVIARATGEKA
jgi:hypothetical protein